MAIELDLENMTDEELNELENGQPEESESSDEKDEGSSQESGEEENKEQAQEDQSEESQGEVSDEEAASQEDELDWLPEEFRGTYKENPDQAMKNVAKSYAELSRKLGENSQYADLLALFKADPGYYKRAVEAITKNQGADQQAGKQDESQQDPLEAKINALQESGIEPDVVDLLRGMHGMIKDQRKSIDQRVQEYDQQQKEQLRMRSNQQAISDFTQGDIGKQMPMDKDELTKFLIKAEQSVNPTGDYGNYTPKDLENAYKIVYPKKYEEAIERRAIERFKKGLSDAGKSDETAGGSASAGTLANAANNNSLPPKRQFKSRQEAERFASELSNEELDELLGEGNRNARTMFDWLRKEKTKTER